MMRLVFVCLLAVLVSACESISPVLKERIDPVLASEAHARQVASLSSWTIEGRISISYEDDAWHAGLFWHQVSDIYQIRIIAPFGQSGAQLDGSDHGVVLNSGEGEFRANSGEQLLAEQLGWQIPVEGLRYWATGRPIPDLEMIADYDEVGRLSVLKQGDWEVEYRSYVTSGGLTLPGKVFLKHKTGLDVRLVVDIWTTRREPVTEG